ncbi:MAG: AraC family transcriptional regulator [Duncaniella sp.]|nr:AraC family transcriptional regulator [Duncaniella sp.]
MKMTVKNMVCRHCVAAVATILRRLGIPFDDVAVGTVDLPRMPEGDKLAELDAAFEAEGFERLTNPAEATAERIRQAIRSHVRDHAECRLNLSACLEDRLGIPYDTLSRLFSQVEGRTIEKYHMAVKTDRVKELLADTSLTLAEIADMTGYSSSAHLSRQFKAVTGMTPREYVRLADFSRTPLPEI